MVHLDFFFLLFQNGTQSLWTLSWQCIASGSSDWLASWELSRPEPEPSRDDGHAACQGPWGWGKNAASGSRECSNWPQFRDDLSAWPLVVWMRHSLGCLPGSDSIGGVWHWWPIHMVCIQVVQPENYCGFNGWAVVQHGDWGQRRAFTSVHREQFPSLAYINFTISRELGLSPPTAQCWVVT